jgi:outer membrane protein assembly factor BamD (BamD/ComL family)
MKKRTTSSLKLKRFSLGLALLTLSIRAGYGCEHDQYDSVHFHSGKVDFGTPPRYWAIHGDLDDRPLARGGEGVAGEGKFDESYAYEMDKARKKIKDNLLGSAVAYVDKSQWARALKTYEWLDRRFQHSGGVRDRIEVLRLAQSIRGSHKAQAGSLTTDLKRYMAAMHLVDVDDEKLGSVAKAEAIFQDIAQKTRFMWLREHALYQMASCKYQSEDYTGAVASYQSLFRQFPRTRLRENALIMMARAAILPSEAGKRDIPAGLSAMKHLLQLYPKTRFRLSIQGLQARAAFLTGRFGEAINAYLRLGDLESVEQARKNIPAVSQDHIRARLFVGYLRRVANPRDFDQYERAVQAIRHLRKSMSAQEAIRFSRTLLSDPTLACSYLYYRLNHCENTPRDFAHLASFADRLVARHTGAALSTQVRVRLAEAHYHTGLYKRAFSWVEDIPSKQRDDRALWVRGALMQKLGRNREALAEFHALLSRYPASHLSHGAREEVAILCEALHDNAGALDQYFALHYQPDIAFFLDARMTTSEIKAYLNRSADFTYPEPMTKDESYMGTAWKRLHNTHSTMHDVLRYTLGVRYLRTMEWDKAAQWLRQVPRDAYIAFSKGRREWDDSNSPDPLSAARELQHLQQAASFAKGNVRAAALYKFATYYYRHGLLLNYNPVLWQDTRMINFDAYWNKDHATHEDIAAARRHMYQHEVYVKCQEICQQIAEKYPHSPEAPKALYRAACAASHLGNLNEWWRNDEHRDHEDEASRLMKRLVSRYPRSPLAHSARKYAEVFLGKAPPE